MLERRRAGALARVMIIVGGGEDLAGARGRGVARRRAEVAIGARREEFSAA